MLGKILVISGPSGSGKTTLISRLLEEEKNIFFSISSTTRELRYGEKNGVNYYYISEEEFKKSIENNEFLEWAIVHKNYYGTLLKPINEALESGKIVIFDIDVQGFNLIKDKFKDIITSVFITTLNQNELKKRLIKRGLDETQIIKRRLMNAITEMSHIKEYDYFLINDDFKKTYKALKAIFRSINYKTSDLDLRKIIDNWID